MVHFQYFRGIIDNLIIEKKEQYDYLLDVLTRNPEDISNIHNLKTDALNDILVYSIHLTYNLCKKNDLKLKDLKRYIKFVNIPNGSIKMCLLNPNLFLKSTENTINNLNNRLENHIITDTDQPRIYLNSRIVLNDEWFCNGIYIDNYFIYFVKDK